MDARKRVVWGGRIVWLLCLCALAIPAIHWYRQHEREVRQREADSARAATEWSDLESEIGSLKAKWNTDDAWEDDLSNNGSSPYTIDFERALIQHHPLMFFGSVKDIQAENAPAGSVVRILVQGRKSVLHLQLSLRADSEQTARLRSDESFQLQAIPEMSTVSAFIATIDAVDRVEAQDGHGDGRSYFVAHGTLHEAYASKVWAMAFLKIH